MWIGSFEDIKLPQPVQIKKKTANYSKINKTFKMEHKI